MPSHPKEALGEIVKLGVVVSFKKVCQDVVDSAGILTRVAGGRYRTEYKNDAL
jgi:hypothetical protein